MTPIIPIILKIWRPVVEICVLTVGIYYSFNFLRRTRGWPVVIGYFLLLALTVITTKLDFPVLSWLLRAFFAVSAIAIIVLFQPEMRRLLAEIGNFQLWNTAAEQREDIEVIIQAAERLVEVHIGALIAIEQSTPLLEMVESSVVVDCEATPEMIETIFFPNNAIHDGGILIKNGRITHAACIFPLTQRQDLNKSLGTRHRAAIGLSEETDAVVVALSEETGSIAHVYKGQMTRGVTSEELRLFLTSVLVAPHKHSSWKKNMRRWLVEQRRKAEEAAAKTQPS